MRVARQGSWLREKSIYSERNEYKEFNFKHRVGEKNRPTDYLDDVFWTEERSWKSNRLYQCKDIKVKIKPRVLAPLMGNEVTCIKSDKINCFWLKGEMYKVVEVGIYYHTKELGVYVTNRYGGDTSDIDYCAFIELNDLWKHFTIT